MYKFILKFYSILAGILFSFDSLYKFFFKSDYRHRFGERFGIFSQNKVKIDIWFHTVSVGEFLAAKELILNIANNYSHFNLLVTTTTPTAAKLVQEQLPSHIHHSYFPYDISIVWNLFWKQYNPQLLIIFETEIWPNLLQYAKQKTMPVIMANARLSNKSYLGYSRLGNFVAKILKNIDLIIAQYDNDLKNFVRLGYAENKLKLSGNIKFDIKLPTDLNMQSEKIIQLFSQDKYLIVAASTHEKEEEAIYDIFVKLRKKYDCALIIIPRHPERSTKIITTITNDNYKFITSLYSKVSWKNKNDLDVLVVDRLGLMMQMYKAGDVAIIGGSLYPQYGGHNPLEAAMLFKPIIMGSNYINFKKIVDDLRENKGILIAQDLENLHARIEKLMKDSHYSKNLAANAQKYWQQNQGALQKTIHLINPYLQK